MLYRPLPRHYIYLNPTKNAHQYLLTPIITPLPNFEPPAANAD
jgi:hypothetical protein